VAGPSSPSAPSRPGGEVEYPQTIVFFRWNGCDEGNEISGDASAELQEDGSLEIELSFDNGDPVRLSPSTAC
jgi:hypothetical protein